MLCIDSILKFYSFFSSYMPSGKLLDSVLLRSRVIMLALNSPIHSGMVFNLFFER